MSWFQVILSHSKGKKIVKKFFLSIEDKISINYQIFTFELVTQHYTTLNKFNPSFHSVIISDKIADLFAQDKEPLNDATIPSEENKDPNTNEQVQIDQSNAQANAGWFNNWFGLGGQAESTNENDALQTTQSPALEDTPDLDRAIYSQQFTILSPFCFGSVGLKSPSCPAHRPTLVYIYFFSFCIWE